MDIVRNSGTSLCEWSIVYIWVGGNSRIEGRRIHHGCFDCRASQIGIFSSFLGVLTPWYWTSASSQRLCYEVTPCWFLLDQRKVGTLNLHDNGSIG